MSAFNRILVVCVGNVCRSPVGAALLKKHLPDRHIESAGLAALVDSGAEETAAALAAAEGLDLSDHRARQLDNDMVRQADLVLVMTEGQRQALVEQSPGASGKVMLFGQWLPTDEQGRDRGREIPDPYRKSREVFEQVHRLLVAAAQGWRSRL